MKKIETRVITYIIYYQTLWSVFTLLISTLPLRFHKDRLRQRSCLITSVNDEPRDRDKYWRGKLIGIRSMVIEQANAYVNRYYWGITLHRHKNFNDLLLAIVAKNITV